MDKGEGNTGLTRFYTTREIVDKYTSLTFPNVAYRVEL